MSLTLFGIRSVKYAGASAFTILYIKVNFLFFFSYQLMLPIRFQSKENFEMKTKVDRSQFWQHLAEPFRVELNLPEFSRPKLAYSNSGRIYVQYNLYVEYNSAFLSVYSVSEHGCTRSKRNNTYPTSCRASIS